MCPTKINRAINEEWGYLGNCVLGDWETEFLEKSGNVLGVWG